MKTIQKRTLLSIAILLFNHVVFAQSVDILKNIYTGDVSWNSTTSTVTFNTTGTMNFPNRETLYNNVWTIPENVKHVVIGKNVTVTGEFYANYDCLIEGMDWKTSVVFGTSQQNYLDQSRGFTAISSADSKERDVVLTVKRLTSLNPKVYHITGSYRGVIHMDSVRVIDSRGGRYNNSDGFSGAKGSTVKNCYFETGEDVIKIYADILVENTTIKMIEFAVPIQCGWGDYGSGITATFKNLKIIGNEGRSPEYAIIEARQGNYTKNIFIDGFTVENPNASLFRLNQADATINVEITNANMSLNKYGDILLSKGTRTICGTTEKRTEYNCIREVLPSDITNLIATALTCTSVKLSWGDVSGEEGYRIRRKTATSDYVTLADVTANTTTYTDNTALANTSYEYMVRPIVGGVAVNVSNAPSVATPACVTNTTTRFEAESYSTMSGIKTETTTDVGAGSNVAYINNNDWCDYSFKVAKSGTYNTKFRVASAQNGGTIQILKGSTVLGSVEVAPTGGWQTWTTINGPSINLSSTGTQTIRLKFVNTSSTGSLFNLNWFEVTGAGATKSAILGSDDLGETSASFDLYPNPADGQFTIDLSSTENSSVVKVYNLQGSLVYSQISEPVKLEVNTANWKSGLYFVKVKSEGTLIVKKLVVK